MKFSPWTPLLVTLALSVSLVSLAQAEVFYLKSGEALEGTLESSTKDTLEVKLVSGATKTFAKNDVLRIEVAPPSDPSKESPNLLKTLSQPTSKYSSPLETFKVWREAAIAGDIDRMVDCYASFRKDEVKKQLKKFTKDEMNKTREATAQTIFSPGDPIYQGDRAVLEVNWQKGLAGESQSLQFILEKNDWKLIQ